MPSGFPTCPYWRYTFRSNYPQNPRSGASTRNRSRVSSLRWVYLQLPLLSARHQKPLISLATPYERKEERTYRDHFLNIINIEVQQIGLAGPTAGVFIRFDDSSAKVLELFIGKTEHGNSVFWILSRLGLEGPIENAAIELLGWGVLAWYKYN